MIAWKQELHTLALTPAEIHLWLVFYDAITEKPLHSAYRELLNTTERHQEPRFYFARDRRRYLVTRALLRTVLSRYIAIHPKEWVFVTDAYGRPGLVNAQATDAGLDFNLSHTHSLIALAVTKWRSLGIDVENVQSRAMSLDIAERYFAPQEAAALTAAPPDQRQYRFFEYWTFKEAYIKARGMGLSLPLDKFSFYYPDDHAVAITIDPAIAAGDSKHWQFWQVRPKPEYVAAICAQRIGAEPPRLVLRQAVPLLSETEITCEFTRVSE